jgi:hypothetical protein
MQIIKMSVSIQTYYIVLPPSYIIRKKNQFFLFQNINKSNSLSSFSKFIFT